MRPVLPLIAAIMLAAGCSTHIAPESASTEGARGSVTASVPTPTYATIVIRRSIVGPLTAGTSPDVSLAGIAQVSRCRFWDTGMESNGGTSSEEHLLVSASELPAFLVRVGRHRVPGEVVTTGSAALFGLTPAFGQPPNGRELPCG